MATIVDNFENTLSIEQNNKFKSFIYDNPDQLIVGGTCRFAFTIDGIAKEDISDADFLFKESLSLIYVKRYLAGTVVIEETMPRHLLIYTILSAEETEQFKGFREVQMQVKFHLKDGNILYGDKATLVVISPLDNN